MSTRIRSVIVFGSADASYTIAAGLVSQFPSTLLHICVIESTSLNESVSADAYALSPDAFGYLQLLGLSEIDFMRSTQATFKLSSTFQMKRRQFAVAYGNYGTQLGAVDFHHYALKYGAGGQPGGYDLYSVAAVMSRLGKFRHPEEGSQSVFSTLDYGWHIETKKYLALLREYCVGKGVDFIKPSARFVTSTLNEENIEKVVLDDGSYLDADLYIDCRNYDASIQENLMPESFIQENINGKNTQRFNRISSYSRTAPYSRIISCSRLVSPEHNIPAASAVMQTPYGFIHQIPLQNSIYVEYSFCADELSDESALASLTLMLKTDRLSGIRYRQVPSRRHQQHWNFWRGNSIQMGAKAHWLDVLAVSSLEQAQRAILRLNGLFPVSSEFSANRDEYNRLASIEYSAIRDFADAHYVLNGDESLLTSEFLEREDSLLSHRINLFKTSGQLALVDLDLISPSQWAALFIGSGLRPQRFPVMSQNDNKQRIENSLKKIEEVIMSAALQSMAHKDYLKRYGVWCG
jgi:tryptophan 7-halogenase